MNIDLATTLVILALLLLVFYTDKEEAEEDKWIHRSGWRR